MPTRLYSLEGRNETPRVVDITLKKTGEDDSPSVKVEDGEDSGERTTVEEVRKSGHSSIKRFSLFRFVVRGWGRDTEDARKKKLEQRAKKKGSKSDKDHGIAEEGEETEERQDNVDGSSGSGGPGGDSEDRRERLDRDMKQNWADLPATLRRKRLRERESILAEFHHDSLTSEASQAARAEPGPSGVTDTHGGKSSTQNQPLHSENLRRTLSKDSLLSTPSSFASSSRASSASSSGAVPSSSSSSTSSSPPPSVNQSPTPEVREARRSSSHPDASSSCPSADNEYETVEVEHAAFRPRPSPSSSSLLLPCISSYSDNQNHSEDSGTDCDHASTDNSKETKSQRTGHRVTFGTPEVTAESSVEGSSDQESVEIRIIKKEEDEGEKGWRLWVSKKGVTVLPDIDVQETSTPEESKESTEVKAEGSVKTDDSGTVCSSESGSAGRSVRELLRRFEECGAVLTGIARESEEQSSPIAEVAKEVPLPIQEEVATVKEEVETKEEKPEEDEDDDDDDDKNDTLRDIQETLLRLEEKVRLYESRLATEYMSRLSGASTPVRSCLEEGTYKVLVPNSAQRLKTTPEPSAEEGTVVSVVEVDGKSGNNHEGSVGDKLVKHQKARAQTAFQQGNAKAEQHDVLLSGWNRNHAGSGQTAASPTTPVPFHSLPATPISHSGSPSHPGPSPGTPPPATHGSEGEGRASAVHDGRHSLLQFAMFHFRQSPEKFEMLKTADGTISGSLKVIESLKGKKALGGGKKGGSGGKEGAKDVADWTWKEQVDLVKFTATPIEESLLRLESPELSALSVECFVSVMRYMGDLPMPTPDTTEVKCVYTILMHCHKHEALRDEVYCQLMKQTTNNKSRQVDSCQRGWRLFSIVAAYFICSSTLKPYLFKYLETAAYDKRRAYHGTATVCLQNLRKTFKYGGRKNVPSVEEITAISAGRNSKRQIYRLPGGTERVINTKSTTVVQDIIEEICSVINVRDAHEMEEFSLYCIVEGDTFTMPLAREEYVLDVTTELQKNQQVFFLIFCRSVWHHPLRLDSGLYVEVVFNQIAPDYLEGLLLVMPGEQLEQDAVYDIAKIASLLHRAADMEHMPTMKETKFLLPKPALAVRDIKPPQWVNMVQSNWREVEALTPMQAKAHTLDILQKWPLFGSSFFAVKRISDPKERSDHILALNRNGVHFIDLVTHETLLHYPFAEVISTRKVKSEEGALFLDMKCGNLMQQRITRLQTDQAHEISRLIRQYITMEQRQRGINGNHSEQQQAQGTNNEVPVSR